MNHRFLSALRLALPTLVLGLVTGLSPSAQGYPKPSIVNSSWSFELEVGRPDTVAVDDNLGNTKWYWYLPYKVTNKSGKDRLFIPEVVILDNNGRLVKAGKNVPSRVFTKVKKQLNNPLLVSPIDVVGKLLQGEDYAKASVAIWPVSQKDVDQFAVLIGGTYGETATIKNPRTGKEQRLRRTVMLRYKTPGSPPSPQGQPVRRLERKDVMR